MSTHATPDVGTPRIPSRRIDTPLNRRSTMIRALLVAATGIVGLIVVLLRDTLLPARFSYDAQGIQAIGQGTLHVSDPAFESVAEVYKVLGLIDDPTAAALLGYVLAFGVLMTGGRRLLRPQAPVSAMLLFLVAALLCAVYLGTYSKDVFVLPVVLLAVLPGEGWRWPVLTGIAMVVYAAVFRTYWFVVLGIWMGLQVVLVKRPKVGWILLAMTAACVGLAAGIGFGLGQSADTFRSTINDGRVGSADASSAIQPVVSGGTVLTGIVNTPLAMLTLMFPLPLLLKGGAYFLALTALLSAFWMRTVAGVRRGLLAGLEVGDRSRIALLLAFIVVQALFEPDYGSALRHLTPLLPIAVLIWSVPRDPRSVTRAGRDPLALARRAVR